VAQCALNNSTLAAERSAFRRAPSICFLDPGTLYNSSISLGVRRKRVQREPHLGGLSLRASSGPPAMTSIGANMHIEYGVSYTQFK
jgi:hypothetical protein